MIKTLKILAIAFVLTITTGFSNLALADVDSGTAKQAAQEVLKDTGAKQIFGKNENGDRLIDQAKDKASKKLNNLADSAENSADLPPSKKLFLKNLDPDS